MPAERTYISWDDVYQLMAEVEEEYGCILVLTARPTAGGIRSTLYWRLDAFGRSGGPGEASAWVGGTLREWNSKTVPGMVVGFLHTLCATIENGAQWSSLKLLEREASA